MSSSRSAPALASEWLFAHSTSPATPWLGFGRTVPDAPLENPRFALAPLGRGPVARALDNSAVTTPAVLTPAVLDSLIALARLHSIPLQVGATNGGNDGSAFAPYGVPDVAIGWPLRYSHSPAEVIDLRDVVNLGRLILAIAQGW